MGICLFAAREISIINERYNLQFQIDRIEQQRMDLNSVGTIFGDGNITTQEYAESNYNVQNGLDVAYNMSQGLSQSYGTPMTKINPANNSIMIHQKAIEAMQYQASQQEKVLEMKMKKLENKLAQLDKEYDSVVKGKEKEIERSTPKYA